MDSRCRDIVGWLIRCVILLGVLLSVSACEAPPGFGSFGGGADKKSKPVPEIDVKRVKPNLDKAGEKLSANFEGFLEREPLGFGPDLPDHIAEDVEKLAASFTSLPASMEELSSGRTWEKAIPYGVGFLFVVLLLFGNRQLLRMAHAWQSGLYVGLSRWLTRLARAAIIIGGRSAGVAIAILFSYFPVQAIFGSEPWTLLLTKLLWLLLFYRALHATVVVFFGLSFTDIADEHANRLRGFASWALRLIFGYLAVISTVVVLEYREDVEAFLRFAFQISLALIPLYFFYARRSLMALFPSAEASKSATYRTLRRAVERNFFWVLAATIALLVLRAAGFVTASTFILVRGYGVFFVVMATLLAADRIKDFLNARRETAEGRDRKELFRSLRHFTTVVAVIFIIWIAHRLLALWEPLITLLKIPLVEVGQFVITLHAILSAGFIIGAALLLSRLVKAVLLIKVFPAFNVDVGVGYAINTLVNYILILVGLFVALAALGVNLSAITVVVASLGVGIGFGLQTLTENLISGFILLFGRSVKKGDFVSVDDVFGQVEAVGARSVLIKTPDNYDMLIPSKEIVGGKIINWSYHDSLVRVHLPVGVSYGADPKEVKDVLLEAATRHDQVLSQPEPDVWLTEFSDSSVKYALLVYFDCSKINMNRLKGQLNFIVWDALHEAGIAIPFPQRDLHLKSSQIEELNDYLSRGAGRDASDSGKPDSGKPDSEESDSEESDSEESDSEEEGPDEEAGESRKGDDDSEES